MAVLYIRNSSGEFEGVQSLNGKTAYQAAKEGGYTGTESEFNAKLAQEIPTALPNPQPITINGQRYDGSEAVTLTTGDLGAATKEEVSQLKDNKLDKTGTAADSGKLGGQLPEHYATAQSVNQLKSDVADITPDDTVVNGKPWTSKKTVDTLCLPFETSGNPVQVYPVEGYPLGVKVSWEPVQAGSGDPSPDNIRPITGLDSVSVTRCGKNLLKKLFLIGVHGTKGVAQNARVISTDGFYLKAGSYIVSAPDVAANFALYINLMVDEKRADASYQHHYGHNRKIEIPKDGLYNLQFNRTDIDFDDTLLSEINAGAMLELGTTATAYEPYTGSTTDITLPETVYGGTLDMETGVVTVDTAYFAFNGDEPWKFFHAYFTIENGGIAASNTKVGKCSHFKYIYGFASEGIFSDAKNIWTGEKLTEKYSSSVDQWKYYLSAQYAAGTPVQLVYNIADPYTIQLDKHQIAALSGVNTIYTDAGTLTVTGREDPRHTIVELKNAIISLGGNI